METELEQRPEGPEGPRAERRERLLLMHARDVALGALFGALAIVLPMAFHALGPGVGPILLPMFLPILALGLLVSWRTALAVGVGVPFISSLLTGMPPLAPPIAPLMAFELGALGLAASLARAARLGVWPATVIAIVAARVAGTVALITIGRALGYDRGVMDYAILSLAVAWPGILLQLTVVPGAVFAIERTSILGPRWKGA